MNKRAVNQLIRNGDVLADFHKLNPSADGRTYLAKWAVERKQLVNSLPQCDARIARSAKQVVSNVIATAELNAKASSRKNITRIPNPKKKRKPSTINSVPFGFVSDPKIETALFEIVGVALSDRLSQVSHRMS